MTDNVPRPLPLPYIQPYSPKAMLTHNEAFAIAGCVVQPGCGQSYNPATFPFFDSIVGGPVSVAADGPGRLGPYKQVLIRGW